MGESGHDQKTLTACLPGLGNLNFHLNRRRMMSTASKQSRFQLDALEERIAPSLLGGLLNSDASVNADVSADANVGASVAGVSANVSASVHGSLGLGL
jgi:hypothetical protein